MEKRMELFVKEFLEKTKDKEINVLSHFDTDGITSAAIIIKTLKKLDKRFSLKILKRLEEKDVTSLPRDKINLFVDLASGSLNHIAKTNIPDIFIIDHHEVIHEIPDNVHIINPELIDKQKISSSGLAYLFSKHIAGDDKDLVKLAVMGMIGDMMESNLDKIGNQILNNGEVIKKRGLLLYPATRPLNRTLEFSANPYIPGVTGNIKGVLRLLREAGINPINGKYKSLLELDETEMSKLITSVMLRKTKSSNYEDIIGDLFLVKLFNKLEDARELSAMINACSRMGEPETALQLCLENTKAKKRAESLYTKYKRSIISALDNVSKIEKVEGKSFVIINAKNQIPDTIAGTITSILSRSMVYEEGTMIITMAYYEDKIKVSGRMVGKNGRNIREVLNNVVSVIGGEVGGHEGAAGCMIFQEKEQEFIDSLKRHLEIEVVKV